MPPALHRTSRARVAALCSLLLAIIVPSAHGETPASREQADPVIAAAGDIACDPTHKFFNDGKGTSTDCHQQATSDLLSHIPGLTAVLTLGDHQYETGALSGFLRAYEPSWGRLKHITHPTIGNHEGSGESYYRYFGSAAGDPAKGYYSYNLGSWHVIALNTNDRCRLVSCDAASPQLAWLRNDLETNTAACTLAYWHHPRYSSGYHGNPPHLSALWEVLAEHGVDVVLTAHDHHYERFAPLNASGRSDPAKGIRSFIVGTGGKSHYKFGQIHEASEVRNNDTFGVLTLTLHPGSYDWNFVPEQGHSFTDKGTGACH